MTCASSDERQTPAGQRWEEGERMVCKTTRSQETGTRSEGILACRPMAGQASTTRAWTVSRAADDHEVHPFYDAPSWQEGFARGYEDGRVDGEHLAEKALRADLLEQLSQAAGDLRLGLRHALETPLAAVHWVERLIEDRT